MIKALIFFLLSIFFALIIATYSSIAFSNGTFYHSNHFMFFVALPGLIPLGFLMSGIHSIKKRRYKKEIKQFGQQVYRDLKQSGHTESSARMQSVQAMNEYHLSNLRNASLGLKDVPEDFHPPKPKRRWLSINDMLGK